MLYSQLQQDSDSDDSVDKAISKKRQGLLKNQSVFRGSNGEPLFHPEPKDIGETIEPPKAKGARKPLPAIKIITPQLNANKDAKISEKTHRRESSVQIEKEVLHIQNDSKSNIQDTHLQTNQNDFTDIEANSNDLTNINLNIEKPEAKSGNKLWSASNIQGGLFRRFKKKRSTPELLIDTKINDKGSSSILASARSTAIDTPIVDIAETKTVRRIFPDSTPILKLNQDIGNSGRASSFIAFQELRYNLFRISNPRTKARINTQFKMSDPAVINAYLHLAEKMKIRSVYFDPELDVLNRYCLEFTAIAMKTLPSGFFERKKGDAVERVFNYMDSRANSVSTPLDEQPSDPDTPVLMTRLFLNEFRMKSDGTSTIGTNVPLLSHSNRLSLERFRAITKGVFERRDYFYKNVDISRHSLDDLE